MKKMRVAIIGQGRSGRDIHGSYFKSNLNKKIEVAYVVDFIKERREKAQKEYGCVVLENYTDLFGKKDIDLVVNASYSQMHYDITKDLLSHGFNVLVEKPFAKTYYECQDLIKTAEQNGVIVAAFHQTLCTPSFLKIKEIIDSGKIGEVFQISLKYSGYSRRWDWQTLQNHCGGSLYNSGPHPIGQALAFLCWDENIKVEYSKLKTIITSGDAEDYGKIILSCPNKPTVDIEICSADCFANDFVFKIFGSYGTIIASNESYKIKYTNPKTWNDVYLTDKSLYDEDFNPLYCTDSLNFIEESGEFEGTAFDTAVYNFYEMMYGAIMEGKPLSITPQKASEVIRIIETCHAVNPLPLKY